MKISNSKKQLAQLLIEVGVTKFPEGADWAAQGRIDLKASFYGGYKPKRGYGETAFCGNYCGSHHDVQLPTLIPNWHQSVLSRDEFDRIVAKTIAQSYPDADAAKADADEALRKLELAGEEIGLVLSVALSVAPVQKYTGTFYNAELGEAPPYGKNTRDAVCDGCGKRYGEHYGDRCKSGGEM